MSEFLNVNEIKEKVSLLNLLNKLGFAAQKVSGSEHFFLSMLREEYTASLCVNDKLGVWYDHGAAGVSGIKSGSIIDFGLAYWYPASFPEVLKKIVEYAGVPLEKSHDIPAVYAERKTALKSSTYQINSISETITNPAINAYLNMRGIGSVAAGHLYELHYSILDSKNKSRNYFASGWPNENGGWEVRNKYFKGCLGHKGMSFLQGAANRLAVFEGFYDFMSWKVENPKDPASTLILNSLSFLQSAKARAKQFASIEIYFDHDRAGMLGSEEFAADVAGSVDCAFKYEGFKDYNEKLTAGLSASKKSLDKPMIFSAENGFGR
ncbi:hypothetical protein GJU39_01335 [Pedobacter petrophilus]|uniref:DNA primase n=1 Tax=Pedobacter petrophilus TaxID=1908241 RepID=A0A7K0FSX6_9SPHI|nr:toprim domain-containing protein [Pedobacter petrophilus]MRX74717.1 hypothetical protein [Pedobacter petrophilus]